MSKEIVNITLSYNGKQYIVHDSLIIHKLEDDDSALHMLLFQWEENNYSCDCNRSLFIQEEYGEDEIDEMDCGNEIKLISIEVDEEVYNYSKDEL